LDVPSSYIIDVARSVLRSLNEQSNDDNDPIIGAGNKKHADITERLRKPTKRPLPPPPSPSAPRGDAHNEEVEGDEDSPLPPPKMKEEPKHTEVAPKPTEVTPSSSSSNANDDDIPSAPPLIVGEALDVTKLKYKPSSFPIAIIACNRLKMIEVCHLNLR
jgi:outer membrane biosynthesis protein TonB